MKDTVREVRTISKATFSNGPLHMDEQVWDDQQELIYNSSVRTPAIVEKTYRKRWMRETNGESESEKSVLTARLDNDEY